MSNVFKRCRGASAITVLCTLCVFTAQAGSDSPSTVLAKVGDLSVTQADAESAVATQIEALNKQRHTLIEKGLKQAIADKLVSVEAAAQGITAAALLEREVQSKVAIPTDADIDAFYEKRKSDIKQPKEQVTSQIRQYLMQQPLQKRFKQFIDGLRDKHHVEMFFDPLRVAVDSVGFPSKGPDSAPITIVEFGDFQCPFCGRMERTLNQVMANYAGQIRLVYRQFPLDSIHPYAQKAAQASLCARDQGKFWQMHDAMMNDQRNLSLAQLKQKAVGVGMESGQFDSCLESDKYADQVARGLAAGQVAGVTGTPALFVNGRFLSGAMPYEQLADIIDDELRRHKAKQN